MLLIGRTPEHAQATAATIRAAVCGMLAVVLCQCTSQIPKGDVVVSVKDQKLGIYDHDGKLAKSYVISTSKFGVGDQRGSNRTPLGQHEIVAKIGKGLPTGAVLKSRHWNGEVLKPNAPGRDPIVSRILWLKGMERSNRNAYNRFIYIHGTPEENRLGKPASYGCVRMGMKDVCDLFNSVGVGARVVITRGHLPPGAVEKPESAAEKAEPADAVAQPIEIAKIIPTEDERKHAEEKEAKTDAQRKPASNKSESPVRSKSKADAKVAGHASSKSKERA